jgi:uncharacterized GH25 family protein
MPVRSFITLAGFALTLALALPPSAFAHRAWMLPSATVLSGPDQWVTVDAAISNDLFYFEHNPLRLENLAITAPDGSPVKAENVSTGKFRSTFDVPLTQRGTYKLAVVNDMVAAMYEDGGETKRWRGSAEAFARDVPAAAKNLQVSKTHSRMEVFVTAGKPTDTVLKLTGVGLELSPITHPNDLVQGEPASFRLLRDGKPAVDVAIAIIPGGIRYRDNLKEMSVSTDQDGKFTVIFPDAGMYWMSATVRGGPPGSGPGAPQSGAGGGAQGGPGGPPQGMMGGGAQAGPGAPPPPFRPGERAIYAATLEVMAK